MNSICLENRCTTPLVSIITLWLCSVSSSIFRCNTSICWFFALRSTISYFIFLWHFVHYAEGDGPLSTDNPSSSIISRFLGELTADEFYADFLGCLYSNIISFDLMKNYKNSQIAVKVTDILHKGIFGRLKFCQTKE